MRCRPFLLVFFHELPQFTLQERSLTSQDCCNLRLADWQMAMRARGNRTSSCVKMSMMRRHAQCCVDRKPVISTIFPMCSTNYAARSSGMILLDAMLARQCLRLGSRANTMPKDPASVGNILRGAYACCRRADIRRTHRPVACSSCDRESLKSESRATHLEVNLRQAV